LVRLFGVRQGAQTLPATTGGASGTSGDAAAKSGSDATAPMATTGERAAMAEATKNGKKKKKTKTM
jgi:hypothetical protein